MTRSAKGDLHQRIETIESAYEFMLAFAARGLSGNEEAGSVNEIRDRLERSDQAMEGLAGVLRSAVNVKGRKPEATFEAFIGVVERDTGNSQAAIQLVLAQPNISSQLIDNLNALIHLRALLTDLFLIDEILQPQSNS